MVVMRLEVRHLRTLCAIADAGSLGKAAAALGYSQPAISKQLGRMEVLLGGELFIRGNSGVGLTPFGLEVLDQARDILSRMEALGRRPSDGSTVAGTMLRLGATETPVLPGLVARIRSIHPEVTVTVRSEYAIDVLLRLLAERVIDVALVLDYPGRELLDTETVAARAFSAEPVFVLLPVNHALAQRLEVPLADLSGEAWFVTPDDSAGWPEVFYDACGRAGFHPVRTHEFLGEKSTQKLIAAGIGVSACQPTMKPIYGTVVKPLQGSPLSYRQLLAWRRDSPAAGIAAALHRLAVETCRELITQAPHYSAWCQRQGQG
jgi:DNA-binding transcriptional LysR family regulator